MIGRTPDLDDLDREIRDHIDAETQDNIGRGMSADEARFAAVRKFGNVARVKEDVRGVWMPGWIDRLRQDARDATRHVRRNPAFSLAVIVTLALGIGLTTAIYSVVNAVLMRPLAYAHPDRMVWLATREARSTNEFINSIDFARWQSQATLLAKMIAYEESDATMVVGGQASRARIVSASAGFWEVSGAKALLGALPKAGDDLTLVLTHHAFREQFHGDPHLIGRAITVDGRQATIGAVLPETFSPQLPVNRINGVAVETVEPVAYRVMVLAPAPAVITPATQVRIYRAIGELKPDVSVEQARAEIDAFHSREHREHPTPFGTSSAVVSPLREQLVGPSRLALRVLLAAALCVLLITCANVANLLLSRSAARRKEIALRMSIGSSPARVVRQLLAESLAYALLGGLGGVLVASWLIGLVIRVIGSAVPRLTETTIDLQIMSVTMVISIGTALLFGVGPAMALAFTNAQEVLKEGGRSVSASRRVLLTGRVMVAMQVALTIVLLAGAGLMFKSVWQMTTYPAGFVPEQILTMRVDFRGPHYREQPRRHDYVTKLLAAARTLPGVRQAAVTTARGNLMLVLKEGEPVPENRASRAAPVSSISADFGPMLGMPLVKGRWLTETDERGAVLINESLARRDFAGTDPINSRIRLPWFGEKGLGTIVGVVGDMKYAAIDSDPTPELFTHQADSPLSGVTLAMRIDGDPTAAAPGIRKALATIDPTQSVHSIMTMEQALSESIAPRRFNLLLLGTFAFVALVLAVLGIYGVVAYAVSERTQEIGIRLALGAERARVVRMIVAQGMVSVWTGIVIGLLAAIAAARLIAGLLYGVEPHDPPTFVLATCALGVVAFVACAAPALRAAFVDPVEALRAE